MKAPAARTPRRRSALRSCQTCLCLWLFGCTSVGYVAQAAEVGGPFNQNSTHVASCRRTVILSVVPPLGSRRNLYLHNVHVSTKRGLFSTPIQNHTVLEGRKEPLLAILLFYHIFREGTRHRCRTLCRDKNRDLRQRQLNPCTTSSWALRGFSVPTQDDV